VLVIQALKLPDTILFAYLVIAAIGFLMLLRDLARRSAMKALFNEGAARLIAEAEARAREADVVRREPWYADNVVDYEEAYRRKGLDGHFVGTSLIDVPDPYLCLPPESDSQMGLRNAFTSGHGVPGSRGRHGTEPLAQPDDDERPWLHGMERNRIRCPNRLMP